MFFPSCLVTRGEKRKRLITCCGSFDGRLSADNLFHDAAADVGQPEPAALEEVRQLLVVDAEQVQDRRLQVVDMDAASATLKPKSSDSPCTYAALDAAAGHPDREDAAMVIAAVVVRFGERLAQ